MGLGVITLSAIVCAGKWRAHGYAGSGEEEDALLGPEQVDDVLGRVVRAQALAVAEAVRGAGVRGLLYGEEEKRDGTCTRVQAILSMRS